MRKTLAVLVLPVLLLVSATAALAEKRIALVIGNSAYETISALDNPKNDADLMRQALEDVGFEVIVARDASFRDMRRAIRKFGRKLRAAGKDAVGLFYYAGHGVQSQGANYLIPIGAQIESDADLSIEALSASQILHQMEDAGNTLNLVILDACRNNPFRGKVRSATRGLSRINAASGTLVAFSAGPGQVALDGTGKNSPYTAALARHIRTPDLAVEEVFKRVRVEVEDGTSGKQTPWEESSLRGSFYFAGRSITVTEKPQDEPETRPQAEPSDSAFDLTFWQSIQNSTSAESYEAYLKDYPEGRFVPLAKIRIKQLKRQQQAAVTSVPMEKVTEPASEDAPFHHCDRLAAHIEDTRRHRKAEGSTFEALEKNARAAIEACRAAVNAHPQVTRFQFQLGRALHVDKRYEDAMTWYRRAAAGDHAAAMFGLGLLYAHGQGVARNDEEAERWYRKAANEGHSFAMINIGNQYYRGKDYVQAANWFRKAAEKGSARAMANLGYMFGHGQGVTLDEAEAILWYRRAAEKGDTRAMYNLGHRYSNGKGVTLDKAEAVRWYRKAAELGDPESMGALAEMYSGADLDIADPAKAAHWQRKASDAGDARSMYLLGIRYTEGTGVVRDPAEAARLIAEAVKSGYTTAVQQMTDHWQDWEPAFRTEFQRILNAEGVYQGAIDGSFGPATLAAIRKLAGK